MSQFCERRGRMPNGAHLVSFRAPLLQTAAFAVVLPFVPEYTPGVYHLVEHMFAERAGERRARRGHRPRGKHADKQPAQRRGGESGRPGQERGEQICRGRRQRAADEKENLADLVAEGLGQIEKNKYDVRLVSDPSLSVVLHWSVAFCKKTCDARAILVRQP